MDSASSLYKSNFYRYCLCNSRFIIVRYEISDTSFDIVCFLSKIIS